MIPLIGIPTRADVSGQAHGLPLLGVGRPYVEALAAAGGAPILIPLDLEPPAVEAIVARVQGVLLPGGEDLDPATYGQDPHPNLRRVTPARDRLELMVARMALERGIPILGVCRGIQVLNVASGGTLYQDLAAQRPAGRRHNFSYPKYPRDRLSHPVRLEAGSRTAQILGATDLSVNSMHHQGVEALGQGWVAVGRAPDGLVEAMEAPDHPFALGVQWHPEELTEHPAHGLRLFRALVEAARAR